MIAPTSTMLAYLPSPPRGVWDIGPFPLRAYALCIIVGIIVAVWWGNRRWMARGGQDGEVLDVAIWAVPFGLVGGRLYHVITDWKTYFGADALKEPIDAVKIWDGGLGIWGAVALGAVGAWIGARRRGIRLPAFGDAIAPPILLAQAIGRVGNYFNQELYGRETTLPWGLEIYERENAAGYSDPGLIDGTSNGVVVAVVHPTFLYELLWNLLIVVLLVVVDRYFRIGHGRLFALYVAGYCLGRFFVELLRDDRAAVANDIAGIRPNLFTASLVFLAAVVYFVVATKGREQGLEMYHDDRAAELAEQGVAGYVDDWYDEDVEPGTSSVDATAGATGTAGSSLFGADDPDRSAGDPASGVAVIERTGEADDAVADDAVADDTVADDAVAVDSENAAASAAAQSQTETETETEAEPDAAREPEAAGEPDAAAEQEPAADSAETVDSETVDSETVDSETVDSETVDSETEGSAPELSDADEQQTADAPADRPVEADAPVDAAATDDTVPADDTPVEQGEPVGEPVADETTDPDSENDADTPTDADAETPTDTAGGSAGGDKS